MALLQLLVFLVALLFCAGPKDPCGFRSLFALLPVAGADFPLLGLYMGFFSRGDVPDSALAILGLAVVSIPFHAVLGYLVGSVLDRRNRA